MKYFLLFFLMISISTGCSKDDNGQTIDTASVATNVSSGNWVVHLYTDSGVNETSNYSGWVFVFNANGTATTSKAGVSFNGTWSTISDDGKIKFVLVLNTANVQLNELSNDWVVKSSTATFLELEDDNTASAEVLHFQKQ